MVSRDSSLTFPVSRVPSSASSFHQSLLFSPVPPPLCVTSRPFSPRCPVLPPHEPPDCLWDQTNTKAYETRRFGKRLKLPCLHFCLVLNHVIQFPPLFWILTMSLRRCLLKTISWHLVVPIKAFESTWFTWLLLRAKTAKEDFATASIYSD